jgi:hypothetical protein
VAALRAAAGERAKALPRGPELGLGGQAPAPEDLRSRLEASGAELRDESRDAGLAFPEPLGTWDEIGELARRVDIAREESGKAVAAALGVLERVCAIGHRGGHALAALGEVHAAARDLHIALNAREPASLLQASSLPDGTHPLPRSVDWVSRGDAVTDEQCLEFQPYAAERFGAPSRGPPFAASSRSWTNRFTTPRLDRSEGTWGVHPISPFASIVTIAMAAGFRSARWLIAIYAALRPQASHAR